MQKVDATKGSSNTGVNVTAGTGNAHTSVTTNMGENITLAQFDQSQLSVVAMGEEV